MQLKWLFTIGDIFIWVSYLVDIPMEQPGHQTPAWSEPKMPLKVPNNNVSN